LPFSSAIFKTLTPKDAGMKICMFTNTYLPHVGGVARSVSFFTKDFRDAGHRVLVVAPTFPGYEEHDRGDRDVFRVPAIQQFNGSDFSVRIPSPLIVDEKMDEFEPDVIHSHHPYLLGDAALRAARRRNLPLIFTHHTLYEQYTHYVAKNPATMKRFATFLSTNYANLCDRVVAPSLSIQKLIEKRGVRVPISEIPTGVDVDFFARGNGDAFRAKHHIDPQSFLIGHLGRLAPEKNLAYLAGAVAQAMQNHPESTFLVVGSGPSQDEIAKIFDRSKMDRQLVMPGQLTGPALADAYAAMDLFAFASTSETQGMVLTEAMAAGVPVLAIDAPGVREVVDNGVNGCLLQRDASEAEFAEVLSRAMLAPEKIADWVAAARRTANEFARDRSAKEMLRLYADMVSARIEKGDFKTATLDVWDKFLLACRAEWDLVTEITETIIQATDDTKTVAGLDEAH
jgi:glycosyltransferase involved in cell wall biosynthesis